MDHTTTARRVPRQGGEPASTPELILDDARPTLPDLATYPPAVRRLIATLTAQVLYHCTIPAPERQEPQGAAQDNDPTTNDNAQPTTERDTPSQLNSARGTPDRRARTPQAARGVSDDPRHRGA